MVQYSIASPSLYHRTIALSHHHSIDHDLNGAILNFAALPRFYTQESEYFTFLIGFDVYFCSKTKILESQTIY